MPYTKTTWINNNEPPISAQNLNKMEQGIYDNSVAVESVTSLLGGHYVQKDVPANAVFTDTTYTAGDNVQINGTVISATDTVYDDTEITERITTAESDIDDLQESTDHLSDGDTVYPYASEIEIEDALGVFAKDVKVKITAQQDLHGYDHPWAGGAGVNKLNEYDFVNNTWLDTGTGSYYSFSGRKATQEFQPCLPNTTYFFGAYNNGIVNTEDYTLIVCWYDSSKNFISSQNSYVSGYVITSPNNAVYFRLGCTGPSYQCAVNYPSTNSSYSPYSNICPISGWDECEIEVTDGDETTKTYTIQLGDTIYGGTINATNGVMTVDRKIIGENNFGTVPTATSSGGLHWADYEDNSVKSGGTAIANMIPFDNTGAWESTTPVGQVSSSNKRVRVYGNFTSQAEFRTTFAGLQIVYELATPITIQLTPQQIQLLEGYNLISANTGDIQVTTTDIKGAIGQADELIEANTQAIHEIDSFNDSIFGTVETGTTASKAYAQGDYFVKDKKMCKALTSIAKGATFTLNTNYASYTLAEILKAIEQL